MITMDTCAECNGPLGVTEGWVHEFSDDFCSPGCLDAWTEADESFRENAITYDEVSTWDEGTQSWITETVRVGNGVHDGIVFGEGH